VQLQPPVYQPASVPQTTTVCQPQPAQDANAYPPAPQVTQPASPARVTQPAPPAADVLQKLSANGIAQIAPLMQTTTPAPQGQAINSQSTAAAMDLLSKLVSNMAR
jgi:hypothetical protein